MASFFQSGIYTQVPAGGDPYGKNVAGNTGTSASFRQRGDATQKRVNNDTRVRDDANSGTAGAGGVTQGQTSMQSALTSEDPNAQPTVQQTPQNASWQATRQPVDLNSVRQRVLQSLTT